MNPKPIILRGLDLAYYDRPGGGQPVVFVHGICSNAHAFEQLWTDPSLAECRLLSFDLPGHGSSPFARNPADYSLTNLSKIVAAFVEQLELENVVLVGHSLGGHAIIHALEHTDRISGIVLIGAAPLSGAEDLSHGYYLSEDIMAFFKKDVSAEELERALKLEVVDPKHAQVIRDSFSVTDGLFREVIGKELGTFFGAEGFVSEIELLNRDGLQVAFVLGDHEQVINATYLQNLDVRRWRNNVHFIRGAAHCPPFESPAELAKLLRDFSRDARQSVVRNQAVQGS